MTLVILDGLTNILATGQKIGQIDQVCNQIEECGGLDKIEMLQQSENEKVYQVALDIIEVRYALASDKEILPNLLQ